MVGVEGPVNGLGDVHEVGEGVFQGQLLEGLGIELVVGGGRAPVSV